ncbi:MAG: MarR family transcriptional regulator [Ilumatobacteraceae bacterium]
MPADLPTLTIARLSRVLENHGPSDLTLPQYRVLGLLSAGDERATKLAGRLAVTKPTLTALIDGLVERGFVVRETADGDRRAVRLSITDAGRAAAAEAGAQLREVLDDVVRRCPDPGQVLAVLDDLRQALDARWNERIVATAAPDGGAPS